MKDTKEFCFLPQAQKKSWPNSSPPHKFHNPRALRWVGGSGGKFNSAPKDRSTWQLAISNWQGPKPKANPYDLLLRRYNPHKIAGKIQETGLRPRVTGTPNHNPELLTA